MTLQRPKILVVNGVCNFDHLRIFTADMQYSFQKLGCTTMSLDAARPWTAPSLEAAQRQIREFSPDFIFSFNAAGEHLRDQEQRRIGAGEVPWFSFMVDDPTFHLHWLDFLRQPMVHCSFSNSNSVRQAATLGIPTETTHLVHVGAHKSPLVHPAERTTDILFIGSVHDPNGIRKAYREGLPRGVANVIDVVSEQWMVDTSQPVQPILDEIFRQAGLSFEPPEKWQIETLILGNANRYVRNAMRLQALRHVRDLPVTVFGDGFAELVEDSNFTFHPGVSFHQALEEINRAKIVFNAQPLAVHGAGERALGAMLNGALLVTSENRMLEREFSTGRDYISYAHTPESLDAAKASCLHYLEHGEEREELVLRTREKTSAKHTWEHRAAEVVELMSKVAAASAAA